MKALNYVYSHAPIPGGGYVSGFAFDPADPELLYCRTDIGGTYRYSRKERRWYNLNESVGMEDLSETFPIALEASGGVLYIACGDGRSAPWNAAPEYEAEPCGRLCISEDGGKSFRYEAMPCYIHGNLSGRGTGKRLVRAASGRLYFASQRDGLLIRETDGSWIKRDICGERFLTFVWLSQDEKVLVTGTAGISLRQGERRGHSLYISEDGGESFVPLAEPADPSGTAFGGYAAHRCASDGRYLYVSINCNASFAYAGWMAYSCDGGGLRDGRVIRYALTENGHIADPASYEDITPEYKGKKIPFGFGGISCSADRPGFLVTASICDYSGDTLWISSDYGNSWQRALHDLDTGRLDIHTSYLKPEKHGGHSPLHWMSAAELNPHDADELWINSGTGVFLGTDMTKETRSFSDCCEGIEETVHLNLYSPPAGEVQLIDILGDLGGFAFRDLTKPCDNSFADENNNRYITCLNADYPDADPSLIVVTARGNWTGLTKGGMILSRDNAGSWERLPLPYGFSEELDRLCTGIEKPNVNPGWAAISADGKTLIFTVVDGLKLWRRNCVRYVISDRQYSAVRLPEDNAETPAAMKVYADRTDPRYFYGFGENSRLYVSDDGGQSFRELPSPLPAGIDFSKVDCADKTEVRGDSGFFGRFYLALEKQGLWLLEYDKDSDAFSARRLSAEGDTVFRCGLGILKAPYIGSPKMIYICAILGGHYGFYRSADEGKSWQLLNDEKQLFGEINSIEGDSRVFGRFFIASGSFGVLYGEEQCGN